MVLGAYFGKESGMGLLELVWEAPKLRLEEEAAPKELLTAAMDQEQRYIVL